MNKRKSGKMERYVSWPCHNVRTMFIEQPASLVASLFERKSKPKGKKQRFDPMFLSPPSHPFDKNASLGKNWERKNGFEKRKKAETKDFIEKIEEIKRDVR